MGKKGSGCTCIKEVAVPLLGENEAHSCSKEGKHCRDYSVPLVPLLSISMYCNYIYIIILYILYIYLFIYMYCFYMYMYFVYMFCIYIYSIYIYCIYIYCIYICGIYVYFIYMFVYHLYDTQMAFVGVLYAVCAQLGYIHKVSSCHIYIIVNTYSH